ncbi:MAG: hypothetical protein EBU82_08715 [Flavobacteriia bacterium]|nr:hypothetical protein [Flavobacteriia bacterium]
MKIITSCVKILTGGGHKKEGQNLLQIKMLVVVLFGTHPYVITIGPMTKENLIMMCFVPICVFLEQRNFGLKLEEANEVQRKKGFLVLT